VFFDRLDHRALLHVYGGMHGTWAPWMIALTDLGSGWTAALLLPLMGWSRSRRFALALFYAIVVQSTLVWEIKRLVGRLRPWLELGWPAPIGSPHDGSFPSGHAAGSFCVAAFLVVVLRSRPRSRATALVIAGLLLLAALIALSRVYLGAHFPGDVLGGALLGASVGAIAAGLYTRADSRSGRDAGQTFHDPAFRGSSTPPKPPDGNGSHS
jgi:undecaprenyl-diphosphatase